MNPFSKIQTPKLAISKARTNLLINHPFFGALAMRLRTQETDEYETMATDGERLLFNAEYIKTLNSDQLVGLLAHVVLHLALRHHERRNGRDPKKWQVACDFAVNPVVIGAGLTLPEGYLDCEMFHGKSAEEIYGTLPDKQNGGGPDQGTGGDGGQDESGNGQPGTDAGSDQSGGEQGTDQTPDPSQMGEVLDRPKDAPASATGDAWEAALNQSARIAEKAGNLPGSLKRFVDNITNPTLPWETLLSRFMTNVSRDDFDWQRPNRHFIDQGLYLPGCYSERIEHMVVAVDTSGSIQKAQLDAFISEINGIRQEVDCGRITVLQCSNRLGETRVFEAGQPINADHIVGGGGTSFHPVFDWLEQHGHDVECLAYFTDLIVRQIPEDPGIPVLWAQPQSDERFNHYKAKPNYGQSVTIQPREQG